MRYFRRNDMLALLAVAILVATVFPSASFAIILPQFRPPSPVPEATTVELLTGATESVWDSVSSGTGSLHNTYWHDSRAQALYLASDLTAVSMVRCSITSIDLKCSQVPGQTLSNVRIRMMSTSDTTSTAWKLVSDSWTNAYGPTNLLTSSFSAGAWYTFTFTTPFIWDGTSNVYVDISKDCTSYISGGGSYSRTVSTSRMYAFASDSQVFPFDGVAGASYTKVPSIRMTYTPLNLPPNIPTLDNQLQMDNAKVPISTPRLKWSVPSDVENNPLNFTVQVDDDTDFSSPLFTRDSSISPTGFGGSPIASPPYTAGSGTAWYDIQPGDGLVNGNTYWWRVRAYDGSNYGDWQRSFFDDFSDGNYNSNPTWTSFGSGITWSASSNYLSPSYVSSLTSGISTPSTVSTEWSFDFRRASTSGGEWTFYFMQDGGSDPTGMVNGYRIRQSSASTIYLEKYSGTVTVLTSGIGPFDLNWHTIKVTRSSGGMFSVYYDSSTQIGSTVTDTEFTSSTYIGIYINLQAASTTYRTDWDNIKAYYGRSFTVDTSIDKTAWHQTTRAQFDSNILDQTVTRSYPNDDVVISGTRVNEGIMAYGEGTVQTPRYQKWTGSSWSGELSALDVGSGTSLINYVVLKASPQRNEYALGTLSANGHVNVQIYSSVGSWGNLLELTTAIDTANNHQNYRGFDLAYESNSGDLIAVVNNNNADPIYYRWNGASWSGPATVDILTTGIPVWIKLGSSPSSNEIILATVDNNFDVSGAVWSGSSWGNSITPETGAETFDQEDIAIAYEYNSNRAMMMWADGGKNGPEYRFWSGSTWNISDLAAPDTSPNKNIKWIRLASDPSSDRIVMGVYDEDYDVNVNVINGYKWGTNTEAIDGATPTAPVLCKRIDSVFEKTGHDAFVFWNTGADGVGSDYYPDYKRYQASAWQANTYSNTVSGYPRIMQLTPNPVSDKIMLLVGDNSRQLGAQEWDGSSVWGTNSILETTLSSITASTSAYEGFMFAYRIAPLSVNDMGMIAYGESTVQTPRYQKWNGASWSGEMSALDIGGGSSAIYYSLLKSCPKRNEYALGTLGADGHVNVQIYNGTMGTWGNLKELTTAIGGTYCAYRGFDLAYESGSGDLLAIVNNNVADPVYYIWNGLTWSSVTTVDLPTTGIPVWIELESNPVSDEIIMAAVDTLFGVSSAVWSGTSWGNIINPETTAETYTEEDIAIAYEYTSNRAILIWADTSLATPEYRFWSGSSWNVSNLAAPATPSADIKWIRLSSDPSSDRIVMGTYDGGYDIDVNVLNGYSWGTNSERDNVGAPTLQPLSKRLDVAYERSGSDALAVWRNMADVTDYYPDYSKYTSSAWQTNTHALTVGGYPRVVQTIPNRNTDEIMLSVSDTSSNFNAQKWDGNAWVGNNELETTISSYIYEPFMFAYRQAPATIISTPINYNDNPDSPTKWGLARWNENLGGGNGDITVSVQYWTSNGWAVIPGKSSNNPAGPIDLSDLNPATYSRIRLMATMNRGTSAPPELEDWTVTWTVYITPSKPILLEPSNNTRDIANSITLSWSASIGTLPITYHVYFGTAVDPPFIGDTGSTSWGSISTTDATTYYWYVQGENIGGLGLKSDIFWFRENEEPLIPQAPTVPVDGQTGLINGSQTVSWTPGGADADGDNMTYYWRVDTDNPPTPLYYSDGGSANWTNSSAFTTLFSDTYFWQVQAYDGYELSGWSTVWRFSTVSDPPNSPTGLGVQGWTSGPGIFHVTNHAPLINWTFNDNNSGDTQAGYHIKVGSSIGLNDTWDSGSVSSTLSYATYSGDSLADGTTYYLVVMTMDSNGVWGNWSDNQKFTMNSKPLPPTEPIAPANNTIVVPKSSQTVGWTSGGSDPDSDQVVYYWFVDNETSFSIPYIASGGSWDLTNSTQFTTYYSKTYYWRVVSFDGYEYSVGGSTWKFNTQSAPPNPPGGLGVQGQLSNPGLRHIVIHSPVLNWTFSDPDIGDTQGGYQIQIGTTAGGNDIWDSDPVTSTSNSAVYSGTTLFDGGDYYFRICVKDNNEVWGDWSSPIQFRMNSKPPVPATPITPSNGGLVVPSVVQTVSWSLGGTDAEGDSVTYNCQVREGSPPPPGSLLDQLGIPGTTSNAFTTGVLKNYYWRARSNDSYEWSDWSTVWNFATSTHPPDPPKGLCVQGFSSPPGILHITNHTPLFNWTFSDSDAGDTQGAYEIRIFTGPGETGILVWDSGQVSSILPYANYTGTTILTDGSIFYLRVCNKDDNNDWGSWLEKQFRMNTPPGLPASPLPSDGAINITVGNSTVNWSAAIDAEGDGITYSWILDDSYPFIYPYVSNGTTTDLNSTIFVTNYTRTYYWQVLANDSYEDSGWTAVWNFSTEDRDASLPLIISTCPSDGGILTNLSATIIANFSEKIQLGSIIFTCTPDPDPGGWFVQLTSGGLQANFIHGKPFALNTAYTINVTDAMDIVGNHIGIGPVPNPWLFNTPSLPIPRISSTVPANNSKNVPLAQDVIIQFSRPMNSTSVKFSCNPAVTGWSTIWSINDTLMTLKHDQFAVNKTYMFTINSGYDKNGTSISAGPVPNPWNFTTADVDIVHPVILNTIPVDGAVDVNASADIEINFSESMDVASLVYSTSPSLSGIVLSWSAGDTKLNIAHVSTPFMSGQEYIINITQCNDLAGNELATGIAPNPWKFTAEIIDTLPPTIVAALPSSGATKVAPNESVILLFSEPMSISSIAWSCAPDPSPGGWSVQWNGVNTSARFIHSIDFVPVTTYTFTISAGEDLSGNTLVAGSVPNPWNFTTNTTMLSVMLMDPNGGNVWYTDYSHSVNWTVSGGILPYLITLELSTNNGTTFDKNITIDRPQNISGKDSYMWTVPDVSSDYCIVRISVIDSSSMTATDSSNSTFTIAKKIFYGNIMGVVTDRDTHVLIADVNVVISSAGGLFEATKVTDKNGTYRIGYIPIGEYYLNVTRKGYSQHSEMVTIVEGDNFKDIELSPAEVNKGGFPILITGIVVIVVIIIFLLLIFNVFGLRTMLAGGRKKKKDEKTDRTKPPTTQHPSDQAAPPSRPAPARSMTPSAIGTHKIFEVPPPIGAGQGQTAIRSTSAPASIIQDRKCTVCGKKNDPEDSVCFWCGADL